MQHINPHSTRVHSDLLTKDDAAELLRTTPRHVERLVELGELAHYRVGRFVRFKEDDIVAFLDRTHVLSAKEA